jgi:alkanesulfonate monooxygenase SsuD/methylene tetrahydromethanopterin reductase-like flavin-dependent oxidoreductase (luciferase family)
MSVKYGLYLPPFGPLGDPAALVDVARRAEAAGWDGVFLWEHVLADGAVEISDPWVTLGAMAAATSRITLGTLVSPLPRRRPWVLARQAGTLSRLSGGRCVLGVGLGADEYGEFSRLGEPTGLRERARLADEALAVITAMWAGKPYVGGGIDVPAVAAEPHRIPVWVAGTLPALRSAHRAVRHDGLVLLGHDGNATPENVALARERLSCTELAEHQPFDIVMTGNTSAAWPAAPAVDLDGLVAAGMTWWMESLIHYDPLELSLRVVDAGPDAVRAASPRR